MRRVVVIFAKAPEPGAVKTRLRPALSPAAAAGLARAFAEDVVATVAALPVVVHLACAPWPPSPFFVALARRYGIQLEAQSGGSLGVRMGRVVRRHVRRRQPVVILGADAPSLPIEYVTRAFRALRRTDVVLGPAFDGGYYLLGVARRVPPIFARMPWGTPEVLPRTLGRLRAARVPYTLLPWWYDVDSPPTLDLLATHLRVLWASGERRCPRSRAALRALGSRGT